MDRWVGKRIEWYLGCRWGVDAFLILQNNKQKPEGKDCDILASGTGWAPRTSESGEGQCVALSPLGTRAQGGPERGLPPA